MDDIFGGPDNRTPEEKARDRRRALTYQIPYNAEVDIEYRIIAMKRLDKYIETGE